MERKQEDHDRSARSSGGHRERQTPGHVDVGGILVSMPVAKQIFFDSVNATVLGSKQAKSEDNSGAELEETNNLEKESTDKSGVVVEGGEKAGSG